MPRPAPQSADDLLTRGVDDVIDRASLEQKLRGGRPLRIKHGVDPTTSDLHLGYTVVYRKLKQFQDAGHTVIFLVGDFTARFGDPTDKQEARALRTAEEVEEAAQSYLDQIGRILDLSKTEVRRNSEWYDRMTAEELLRLTSHFTIQRMLERDMFTKRLKAGHEIRLQEPIYPVLQAYDSVMLKADATVIGSDQTFNELQARELQRQFNQAPQDLVLMPLLRGTDGKRKMSQSLGNAIGITEDPDAMFGQVMSIPDTLIGEWLRLCTDVPEEEIRAMQAAMRRKELNPRDAKARLARELVTVYHGRPAADRAETEFVNVFRERRLPSEMPSIDVRPGRHALLDFLVAQRLVTSRSEGRRLIEQGGVRVDGRVVDDWAADIVFKKNSVLQLGPRRFFRATVIGQGH